MNVKRILSHFAWKAVKHLLKGLDVNSNDGKNIAIRPN